MEEIKQEFKGKTKKENLSFVEHLDVLRKHLFRGIIAIFFFAVIAFFFKGIIFDDIILKPKSAEFITSQALCSVSEYVNISALCINQNNLKIINIKLAGQFKAHLVVSMIFGFLIAFPYLVFELWRFVKPALREKETSNTRGMIFWVSSLFSIGVLFGYFIIVPLAINFLGNYSISDNLQNTIDFSSYFSTLTTTTLGTGIVFEMPIAAYVMAKLDIINPELMKSYRKHAVIIALIISGILTPPDVFSQILVAIPMALLYEISIVIVRRVHKRKAIEEI